MKRSVYILFLLIPVLACNRQPEVNSQEKLVQSVLWYQHSAEMHALYYQGYNLAGFVIEALQPAGEGKPYAVVLDIDETVLDNSPQSAQQIFDGQPYSEELWDEWSRLAEAAPLPGALEFTRNAAEKGIAVFYITNRMAHTLGETIENLQKFGFPDADSTHVLPRPEGSSSSKNERRAAVAASYDIVLFLGDNLGDFDGMFDDRSVNEGKDAVALAKDQFGRRFIIFPNPVYGYWERAALSLPGGEKATPESVLKGFR
ncbi:MAG: 5'-nucleotidase, lipoprotein e(P4) family [Bacteroidota bacterium]